LKLQINLAVERRLGDPLIKIVVDDYLTLADGPALDRYEFDINIPDDPHSLKIVHYGKTINDHQYNESGKIVIDKHVEISNIVMDNIKLERELWDGKFFPVYMHKADNEPYFISPNLYLGHNGTWSLEFVSPVAKWLIDLRCKGTKQLDNTIFKTNRQILESAQEFFKDLPDL
jgi:hypothetical protein